MIRLHRDFIHLQRRAKRDLYGLILGRVIDDDTCATMQPARRYLRSSDRFSTVFRLHLGGYGLLFIHAKHLPYYDRHVLARKLADTQEQLDEARRTCGELTYNDRRTP